MIELRATTANGARLVALAESLVPRLAERAGHHDREGTFPHESIAALAAVGYFAAPVPEELGGLGVSSVHDLVVASSRLARGDASVAIGVNMHLVPVLMAARRRQTALAAGNDRRAQAFAETLEDVARRGVLLAAATSEPAQDLTRPATIAARTDTGWRISGHKVFCTMSPAASVLYVAVTFVDDDGGERYGYAIVPVDTPGVTIHDDWDGLGMRASGSNSVTFDDVELPPRALRGGFTAGEPAPFVERNLAVGLFHASSSLGIAEAAAALASDMVARRNGHVDGRARMLVAESAIDLAASRALIARTAGLIDGHYEANPTDDGGDDELLSLFAETQAAKTFVNESSTRVVDRALALSGGAGYLNGSPLARAVRDVRAGAFMHPLGANRAYEYLASTALGQEAVLR